MHSPNGHPTSQPKKNGAHKKPAFVMDIEAAAPEAESKSLRQMEPTGREVSFGQEELLVSKTDLNGRITYANDVFCRVSGFSQSEVIGQAHSFIRHPDMPRCIFKMLWDSIQSGKEIFAYVVNLTKNGDAYWVMAHLTPNVDDLGAITGYHSTRRCPDRHQVVRFKALYERLMTAERGHARKADAITASSQLLESVVAETHKSYEEFCLSI